MAGEIKHSWNGTVLTITSDSGTSSMDLKGSTGDLGPRGPQGPAGVIYDENGITLADNLATTDYVDRKVVEVTTGGTVDLEGYATKQYVDETIENIDVDLSEYATKEFVNETIANADVDVDLTNYATKQYVDNAVKNTGGTVDLSGYATEYYVNNMGVATLETIHDQSGMLLDSNVPIDLKQTLRIGSTYDFTFTWDDGVVDQIRYTLTKVMEDSDYQGYYKDSGNFSIPSDRILVFIVYTTKPVIQCFWQENFVSQKLTGVKIVEVKGAKQFLPQAIPIDNSTIKINAAGQLYSAGGSGSADLSNYYTKTQVDNKISSISAAPTHTWGTTDITAGSASTEPTGTLHLVIE